MSDQESPERYIVVARRYRPKAFAELVGQDHIAKALGNAIDTGRVGHAYLFTGARGTGKTSTARIFAKCLNDPAGPTMTPDLDSDVAQAIDAGEDIDVIEIDGASNRGIEEIRQLRSNIAVRPSRARFKIYIIDEVHMLTTGAFNALLKTLEEPPEHVKFIFCTTDPEKIPITVLSRCQRFDFVPVGLEDILGRLQEIVAREGAVASEDALRLLARRAAGSMRDSQSLLEQVLSFSGGEITVEKIHAVLGSADDAHVFALVEVLCQRDAPAALRQLDIALQGGVDAGQLSEQLLGNFRDLMVAAVGGGAELLRYSVATDYAKKAEIGAKLGLHSALAMVQLLDQAVARMRQSIHSRIVLEAALIQICYLPDLDTVAAMAAALKTTGANAGAIPVSRRPTAPAHSASASGSPPAAPPATEKKNVEATIATSPSVATKSSVVPSVPARSASNRAEPSRADPAHAAPASPPHPIPATAPVPSLAGVAGVAVASVGSAESPSSSPLTSDERPDAPAANIPLSVATVGSIWTEAIGKLDDLTVDYARAAHEVSYSGESRIRVAFAANQQLNRAACEKPERRAKLERLLSEVAGCRVQLEFTTIAGAVAVAPPPPVAPAVSRAQRMRSIEQDPIVQQLMEIFEGEIVRVEEPRPAKPN